MTMKCSGSASRAAALALACLPGWVPVSLMAQGLNSAEGLPSLSARHVRHHEPTERVLLEARIDLSSVGLRVRQDDERAHLEIRQDFIGERAWLMDRRRNIALPVPMNVAPVPITTASGFLSLTPCGDLAPAESTSGRWRGRLVQRFQCLDPAGDLVADELVDDQFGIVVYRRTRDGVVDELHDLRARSHDAASFTLPSRFRSVEKRELIHGVAALPEFNDSSDE